ncbi:MAG: DUF421 domain-containing protein [Deltaproteobacteria bacterium]|nr:DUF421 domain-containing protein [Deltaproteobacteria bacterium]
METMIRGAVIYVFLLVVFRFSGKRSLAHLTTFDFVLLLIIAEATQQTMLGDDFSITNGLLLIATLMGLDVLIAFCKQKWARVHKLVEGVPLVIVEDGRPVEERLRKARVDEDDILTAARETQGLERMEQIKYAVLERSGGISIIPQKQ